MEYRIIKQRKGCTRDLTLSSQLTKQFSLSPLCADLMISKGFTDIDSIERYLRPSPDHFNSPFDFNDMEKAVDRIRLAIGGKEKIFIYGDYDCDGVCASVILYKYLVSEGADVEVYLPDRLDEGYGINMDSAAAIAGKGCRLMITVDNGIAAFEQIAYLNEKGVDVIVTDHHEAPNNIPEACAVIDPKCPGENYPFREICGATTAFRLCEGLGLDRRDPLYYELLVFDALATVADVVPLIDENRTVVSLGIKALLNVRNTGLAALLKVSQLRKDEVSASDISFKLAPRINAAGRLGSALDAFELFTTDDPVRAAVLAGLLDSTNEERKAIEEGIIEKCEDYIRERDLLSKEKILFIATEESHSGVVGIAAGKITEKYNRPCIVGSIKDGKITASARSIPTVNIYDLLMNASPYYEKFGGHSQAAGLTLREEDFEKAAAIVNEAAERSGIDALLIKTSYYDMEAAASCLTMEGIRELDSFAPFGFGNPKPVMLFENVQFSGARFIGSDASHVKATAVCGQNVFQVIGFSMADTFRKMDFRKSYDVLFTPSINSFRGKDSVQLEIKEIQPSFACPEEYYDSLYRHFYVNDSSPEGYVPSSSEMYRSDIESAVDERPDDLFIVYGKDMFLRLLKYAEFTGRSVNVCYGRMKDLRTGSLNILVNPVGEDVPGNIPAVVCDPPVFSGYEMRFYLGRKDTLFIDSQRYVPAVMMDRTFAAAVYKKLGMLPYVQGDMGLFLERLNAESPCRVNSFLLRICLDIFSELGIIEYILKENTLQVRFCETNGGKNIMDSTVMQKIRAAYR